MLCNSAPLLTIHGYPTGLEQEVKSDLPTCSVILSMTFLYVLNSILKNILILQKPLQKVEPETIAPEFSLIIRFISIIFYLKNKRYLSVTTQQQKSWLPRGFHSRTFSLASF